ncbi:ASST-domain-containing protein, partial [Rhodocollybia butyracea]
LICLSPTFLEFTRSDSVYIASQDYFEGAYGDGPYQTFFSSNYTPVAWNFVQPVNKSEHTLTLTVYLFNMLSVGESTVQPGACIFDNEGQLVWDASFYNTTLVFQVETYLGEPHIVIWSGDILNIGVGSGYINLLNSQYQRVARYTTNLTDVSGPVLADFHDTRITSRNTAMMTSYPTLEFDLSPVGGPATGYILDSVFQEHNISSGETLFTWHASDHVDPSVCHNPLGGGGGSPSQAWDYFHINSIDPSSNDGNYLISSRHCFAVYFINGTSGDIIWQMGGDNSSFTMGNGTEYSWQHHARWACMFFVSDEPVSRALYLGLNFTNMTVELIQEFLSVNDTISLSQGSAQAQPNGDILTGWGFMPWYGEFTSAGDLIWKAQFGVIGEGNNEAYRMLRFNWTGEPTAPPDLAVANTVSSSSGSSNNMISFYVSWNGDTRTSRWELIGASDSSGSEAQSLYNQTRTGFETTITFNTAIKSHDYYAVRALSGNGTHLGTSNFTKVGNGVLAVVIGGWRMLLVVVSAVYALQTL